MKLLSFLFVVVALTSCAKINRILDGTENLPNQIDETNRGMRFTNEGIRKQKQSEALKMLKEQGTRSNLNPPSDMMPPAKTLAESLNDSEALLFFKNYIIKIKSQEFGDVVPMVDIELFNHNRKADYIMLELVAGFLPEATIDSIIASESKDGAYQDIMMAILKLRADFNSERMLKLGLLGAAHNEKGELIVVKPEFKLDTLGKIENAIQYNEKVEKICKLEFANKIDFLLEEFNPKAFSQDLARDNWKIILERAESDYKVKSLKSNPRDNEQETEQFAKKYQDLLAKLKSKSQ